MSKNISIKEGNENKQFTAKKLQTNLQNGGTCFWVPEDETKLITKRVNAPGEYIAANEEVEQGQDPIYGYSKVTVSGVKPDADTKLISKSVTANGTYKVSDEPVDTSGKKPYGYSTVHVNVKGGGKYTDPDTGQVVRPDPSPDPGSTIVGTNPDTGNEEAKTIDDNGNLKSLELASYIQLDTPPTKMEYKDGERIMMAGAVAHGYKQDGTPYKGTLAASELPWHQYGDSESSEYSEDFLPGGIVLHEPQYADINKTSGPSSASSKYIPDPFIFVSSPLSWESGQAGLNHVDFSGGKLGTTFIKGLIVYAVLASDEPFSYQGTGQIQVGGNAIPHTLDGKTVYWAGISTLAGSKYIPINPDIINYTSDDIDAKLVAWTMYYGEINQGGKQPITLTWPREGDRKHLQTSFDITVTE